MDLNLVVSKQNPKRLIITKVTYNSKCFLTLQKTKSVSYVVDDYIETMS